MGRLEVRAAQHDEARPILRHQRDQKVRYADAQYRARFEHRRDRMQRVERLAGRQGPNVAAQQLNAMPATRTWSGAFECHLPRRRLACRLVLDTR